MKLPLALILLLTAVPAGAGLVNGGFETGDLTGWTVGGIPGNAQVLTAAQTGGVLTPADGRYFAVISTYLQGGEREFFRETDLTSSPFDVSKKGENLTFVYNFMTDQNIDGTGYPDTFSVVVLGRTDKTILSGMVKRGYPPNILVNGGSLTLPDGTSLIYGTGPTMFSFSLNDFVGQTVSVEFIVKSGDREAVQYDSALYIDKVAIVAAPEPANFFLLGTGLLLLAAFNLRAVISNLTGGPSRPS